MSLLIRGATIPATGGPHAREPFGGDLRPVGDTIADIGTDLAAAPPEEVHDVASWDVPIRSTISGHVVDQTFFHG